MTETRTARLGLPQWSAGTDGPSRSDFNEAFLNLENRVAYDDGATVATLPSTGMVAARYYWHTPASTTYRTLWRYDGSSLYFVGGPTIPATQLFRGFHSSVAGSAANEAIRIEHPLNPDDGGWGGHVTYAGAAYLRTGLALGDDDDTAAGRLAVGAPALPSSGVRLAVHAYASSEHAVVARAHHGSTPGNLFRGLDSGDNAVFTVDGTGRLNTASPSAFGGIGPQDDAALAIAPVAGDTSGVVSALDLYGLTDAADPDDVDKALLRAFPDSADSSPILSINRLAMRFGRIAWGTPGVTDSGVLRFDANTAHFRTTGSATGATRTYFHVSRSSLTDENDISLDASLFSVARDGVGVGLPTYMIQRQKVDLTTLMVRRVTDFSKPFLDVARVVPDGGGGELPQFAGQWLSDGAILAGAWWRSTGTMRDARQSVHHRSTKVWAGFGSSMTAGQAVAPEGTFTYTFGAVTLRNTGTIDLRITLDAEILLGKSPNSTAQGQVYGFECFVSINGGTFNAVGGHEENVSVGTPSGAERNAGDRTMVEFLLGAVTGGSTVQVRFRTSNGIHPPTLYLRKFVLGIEECMIETYTAP